MKRNCFLIGALLLGLSPALADNVTVEISPSTGTFSETSGWSQSWTSASTSPRVVLTASRKDMKADPDGIGIDMNEGTAHSSTYTISTSGAWRVGGYTFTFKGSSADNPTTITAPGLTMTSDASTNQTFAVTGIEEGENASFTLTGNNMGIYATDFKVTLIPVEPEPFDVVTVDLTTGTLSGGSSLWRKLWSMTPDENGRQIFLSCTNSTSTSASNLGAQEGGTGIVVREGAAHSNDLIISSAGAWRVSGFEMTFIGNTADKPVTVSSNGQTATSSTDTPQTIAVSNLGYGEVAKVNFSGSNGGVTITDFKVHVTPMSPDKSGVHVFVYNGYHPYSTCYRIPTLAYIPAGPKKGRILAVNDFRPCGMDIGYGEVDLHTSVSNDGGYNWTFPADPVDADGNHVADGDGKGTPATSNKNRDCGFGDPSIVADRETGELLMLGVSGRVPIGQTTREIPQGIAIWRSADGGDTWTPWKDITEDILGQLDNNCKYGRIEGLFFTAGRLIQSRYIKAGSHYRVYAVGGGVVQVNASSRDTQCWVFYSDDLGDTWHILGDPYNPALSTGGAEPKCEELPDGSLLYSGRTNGGRNFNIFTYTDYPTGQGHWDENHKFGSMVSGAPGCDGDAMVIPVRSNLDGSTAYLLMQSIPLNPSSRVNVGINYKVLNQGYDDFGTVSAVASDWDGTYQVSRLGSAYSSLTLLADGTLGFIFEETTYGRDYTEVYRRLTVDQITHGAYTYDADADMQTALRLTRELVEGKTAAAQTLHTGHPELTEAMNAAAKAFLENPSPEAYIAFNRALRGVETGKEWESGIDEITAASTDDAPVYDLMGRRAEKTLPGRLYITASGRKFIK